MMSLATNFSPGRPTRPLLPGAGGLVGVFLEFVGYVGWLCLPGIARRRLAIARPRHDSAAAGNQGPPR